MISGMAGFYHIAGKFSRGKIWQIDSFRAIGKKKFGKLIDQLIDC